MKIKLNTNEDKVELHFDGLDNKFNLDPDKTMNFAPEPGINFEVLVDTDGYIRKVSIGSLKKIMADIAA